MKLKSLLANVDGEAWLRFFMGVAGLALAFAAAVFSSVARESGNVLATALFASTALLLAGVVGVLTVPFLARRVAAARVREAFDYELTREGMVYLGLALIIGIAALNTGNNLLFIVLAAMLAAIIVSGLASAAVLRRLKLDLTIPQNAFAGRAVAVHVKLENPRLWMPAFSVRVFSAREKKPKTRGWEWRRAEFAFPKRDPWVRLKDYKLEKRSLAPRLARILIRPVYFTYLPAGNTVEAQVDLVFPRRGRYTQDAFSLATRFPFSFLMKSRKVSLQRELLVYPAQLESDDFLDLLPLITGEFVTFLRGRGSELYRIREYTPQDPGRHVDWKATAKTGSLKVREFTREDERRMRIVFDNSQPGAVTPLNYEKAVSMAATLACHFWAEDVELSFAGSGYSGGTTLDDFLRYLALVQPEDAPSMLESLPVSHDFNVIITARKKGSIPTALWVNSHVIYM